MTITPMKLINTPSSYLGVNSTPFMPQERRLVNTALKLTIEIAGPVTPVYIALIMKNSPPTLKILEKTLTNHIRLSVKSKYCFCLNSVVYTTMIMRIPIAQSAAKLILMKLIAPITLVTNLDNTSRIPQQKRAKNDSINRSEDDAYPKAVGETYVDLAVIDKITIPPIEKKVPIIWYMFNFSL
jgi:hypothetical protein